MLKFNLLPWREKKKKVEKKKDIMLIVGAVIFAVIISLLWHSHTVWHIGVHRKMITVLEEQISDLSRQMKTGSIVKKERDNLVEVLKFIEQVQLRRHEVVRLFNKLAEIIPKKVFLTEIICDQRKITLVGQTETNAHIVKLMKNIASVDWLDKADLDEINQGKNMVLFNLNMQLLNPEIKEEACKKIKKQ